MRTVGWRPLLRQHLRLRFPLAVAAVASAGVVLRVLWVLQGNRLQPEPGGAEMFHIARAFAMTGRLADAYGVGTGPTAHATPLMPMFSGTVYRLFGVGTPLSQFLLLSASLVLVGVSIWAANAAARRLSIGRPARLAAIAYIALVPVYIHLEAHAFRLWDGAAAAAIIAACLAVVLRLDAAAEPPSWIKLLALVAFGAAILLLSTSAAVMVFGSALLLAFRRRGWWGMAGTGAAAAVLAVLVLLPWALRNEAVFGEKIWTRSSFGYISAEAFYDGAVHPADIQAEFQARVAEIDPWLNPPVVRKMQAMGGEAAYSRHWTSQTKRWVAAHPAGTLYLVGRHAVQLYFPPRWFIITPRCVALKQAAIWAVTLLAFFCLGRRLWRRDWRWLYVAAALILPEMQYLLVLPSIRFLYPVTTLMTFLACDVAFAEGRRAAAWIAARRGRSGVSP